MARKRCPDKHKVQDVFPWAPVRAEFLWSGENPPFKFVPYKPIYILHPKMVEDLSEDMSLDDILGPNETIDIVNKKEDTWKDLYQY